MILNLQADYKKTSAYIGIYLKNSQFGFKSTQ